MEHIRAVQSVGWWTALGQLDGGRNALGQSVGGRNALEQPMYWWTALEQSAGGRNAQYSAPVELVEA